MWFDWIELMLNDWYLGEVCDIMMLIVMVVLSEWLVIGDVLLLGLCVILIGWLVVM